jgi:TonB family protein
MNAIESWLLNYLLNSLWQVPLVFAAVWLAVRGVRRLGPVEEHRMWTGALFMATLLPACAVNASPLHLDLLTRLVSWFATDAHTQATVTVAVGAGRSLKQSQPSFPLLHAAMTLYALAMVYAVARLAWGIWQTHRLRKRAHALPQDAPVQAAWLRCRSSFGLHNAEIAVVPDSIADSANALSPMTIGVRRRLLLLPVSWLATVSAEDMDAAIAHECAHMQRYDFAKNLLYRVLTLPVSYHPAVWLMQARVTETREMVCDAVAAEAAAGREQYTRSLLRLAAKLVDCGRSQNLHAIGIFDANSFERRVMNLTMNRTNVGKLQGVAIKASCAVLGFATTASALALRMQVATPAPAAARQSAAQPAPVPQSFVLSVPRATTGQPAQSFKINMDHLAVAEAAPNPSPAPMYIKMLTPATVEPEQKQSAAAVPQVSAAVMAGNVDLKVSPVYPQAAKDAKIQGAVLLHAIIGKDGTMQQLSVISGPPELQSSALEAVKRWIYKPYLLNGEPTEVETTITVNYSLNK